MAGYANRNITLEFPGLSEPDDLIWVQIRNPRTVPPTDLIPREVATNAQGRPIDREEARAANREIIAGLVRDWHVYDAKSTAVDQPLLDLPATPESVGKLPIEIIVKINEAMDEAVDPPSPQTPTTTTS